MSISFFPCQTVPEADKLKPSWGQSHLDYAEALLLTRNTLQNSMDRTYRSYNGDKIDSDVFKSFQTTYGKRNKAKIVSYRYGRNKMNLLQGEYIKRPIKGTVETENS